jgi:ATP-binding cassette subfamily C protein LapB
MTDASITVPEPAAAEAREDYSPWLEAVLKVARHYRLDVSPESVRLASVHSEGRVEEVVRHMARQAGLSVKFAVFDNKSLSRWRTPLVVQLRDGQVGVLESIGETGELGICFSGDQGLQSRMEAGALAEQALRTVILRPTQPVADVRTNDYIKPYDEHWFRRIVLTDLRPYSQVMIASLVANLLGMAGVLFSMQVYDRVIPAESLPTLYVLFGGVMLALLFDFVMRILRLRITDVLGKRADLRVSDLVFGHALRLRNSARPKSTGSFISQLRELEQIRDLITSSTATALADMPFFLLFLLVFYLIGGPLVLIPLVALVFMLLPGIIAQPRLARLANASMREAALRNAMLVESIQGLDDIKALQAEQRFQQQWNQYNAASADSSLRLRTLTNSLVAWTQNVQGGVFAVVIVFGAPMVIAGDLTTGSLVAASILSSRMMGPMAQLTHVLTRWQQAKVALEGLNRIMQMPVDHPEGSQRVHLPAIRGDYRMRQASDQEIIAALTVTGALDFVRQLPKGMDHLVLEGGLGLSGGQRQSLLLSRLLIRQPQVLLLDEPTAALDDVTERLLLEKLATWTQGRTLVVATHRVRVLQLVERIIVLDNGRIVIDDHRDAALARLRAPGKGVAV